MKISAIMPVYNEEKTVKNVLKVLNKSKELNEVIVVNDGSTDNSLKEIKKIKSKKIKILNLKKNIGKSEAVKKAVKKTKSDILFFCDADLLNLKKEHISQILEPLKKGENAMSAGLRDRTFLLNKIQQHLMPLITGERAIKYKVFKKAMKHELMKEYGMEAVLNDYCKRNNIPIHKRVMKGVKHVSKVKKNKKNGLILLIKEMLQVFKFMNKLRKERKEELKREKTKKITNQ
ncbi:hypothetical protein B6U93_00750 [Candidatus Woesearchaeota archaeon ex4484_78]|nr:MAG: hypothetical protein B6U93_00750 [Candidatus Woesearchaeota archaeon ex4484_78]